MIRLALTVIAAFGSVIGGLIIGIGAEVMRIWAVQLLFGAPVTSSLLTAGFFAGLTCMPINRIIERFFGIADEVAE